MRSIYNINWQKEEKNPSHSNVLELVVDLLPADTYTLFLVFFFVQVYLSSPKKKEKTYEETQI